MWHTIYPVSGKGFCQKIFKKPQWPALPNTSSGDMGRGWSS